MTYDANKYKNLFSSLLELTNREIFTSAFTYFFDEEIIFLNLDFIYDESESFFCHLIDSLRNNTYVIENDDVCGKNYKRLITYNDCSALISKHLDLMSFVVVWFNFLLTKIKSLNMVFEEPGYERYIDAKSGSVYQLHSSYLDTSLKYRDSDYI